MGPDGDLETLLCKDYTDEQIEEDSKAIDYDMAYKEAHQLEDI
jgi:hypothetical protein